MKKKRIYKNLTFQVAMGILLGIIVGAIFPNFAPHLKILADIFIKLVKMLIAPIIFLTIVIGIGNMGDLKKVGKIGGKALIYFEIVSTIALVIGFIVVHIIKPGINTGIDITKLDTSTVKGFTKQATSEETGFIPFIMNIIPEHFVGAIANGQLLPILVCAALFGLAAASVGEAAEPILKIMNSASEVFFKIIRMVMFISPLAAFGAMAYTIGSFGFGSLKSLILLMVCVYITMALFIIVVLGGIMKGFGLNLFKLLGFIKEELILVLGTSSSETALPGIMKKLEKFGCSKQVVGLVVPTGYSFNLDGTAIYLSMAALFIAQVYNVDLSLWQQITLLLILMVTSKGAAGVTGSGFVTLAATLVAFPLIPVAGIALLIGVDRFMSEARAITNIIGNSVATIVVAKLEKEFDEEVHIENTKKNVKEYV